MTGLGRGEEEDAGRWRRRRLDSVSVDFIHLDSYVARLVSRVFVHVNVCDFRCTVLKREKYVVFLLGLGERGPLPYQCRGQPSYSSLPLESTEISVSKASSEGGKKEAVEKPHW